VQDSVLTHGTDVVAAESEHSRGGSLSDDKFDLKAIRGIAVDYRSNITLHQVMLCVRTIVSSSLIMFHNLEAPFGGVEYRIAPWSQME